MSRLLLASWNVNSINVRLPQVLDWLERSQADALLLEETKTVDALFPHEAFAEAGFDAVFSGQRAYNGVAIVTRRATVAAPESVETQLPGWPDAQRRYVSASIRPLAPGAEPLRVACAYVPNGQAIGAQKYLYKLDWLGVLARRMKALLAEEPRLVLGGDFNIVPAEADSWDPARWEGGIFCSAPERAALARLFALGLEDSFRMFPQPAGTFSWWDYRQDGFERNRGLRIDLMLVSRALRSAVRSASIDSAPRALPKPSDHAPALLELEL